MSIPMCQILVCTNERPDHASKPSCGPRGGLEVYRKFKDIVRERGVRNEVMVNRTGCLKHCSQGITVAIQPRNRWYAGVTLDDVEEVVDRSACSNEIIERLVMPDIPWE